MGMTREIFFELVEIRTKLASLFPFLIGLLFSKFYFQQLNIHHMIVFFVGMLVFDMATTAINNFMDFRKAQDADYRKNHNIIGKAGLNEKKVGLLILGMITLASLIGIYLTVQTSMLLLLIGGVCFFIGIFYTFGPIPLSRMPLGELFSGGTMGFGIFFITIYLNTYDLGIIDFSLTDWQFVLKGDIQSLLVIILASLPMVFTIANIMLANNICDLEQDIRNHRYTLPFYIGKETGIQLFGLLMYSCYVAVTLGVVIGVYRWPMLLTWGTFPLIYKNIRKFKQEQSKSLTFPLAIQNLVVFNTAQIIGLLISLIF